MSMRRLLEEFPARTGVDNRAATVDEAALEAAKGEGYESGYASGWEDAVAAERRQRTHLDAEFQRCIQDMGFTYHEAVDQVRAELAGFLTTLVDALFPALIADLVRETVRTEATELAEGQLNPTVRLLASAETAGRLQDMLPEDGLDIAIEVEPSLPEHQAFLTLAGQERAIDFQPLIASLRDQLAAMTAATSTEVPHDG